MFSIDSFDHLLTASSLESGLVVKLLALLLLVLLLQLLQLLLSIQMKYDSIFCPVSHVLNKLLALGLHGLVVVLEDLLQEGHGVQQDRDVGVDPVGDAALQHLQH